MDPKTRDEIKAVVEHEGDVRWIPLEGKPGFKIAKRGTRVLVRAPENRAKILPPRGGL
jgi:hypothetical protein